VSIRFLSIRMLSCAELEFRNLVSALCISLNQSITCCRDAWARTTSKNPNVKVYIGAPASSTAAGSGYVPIGTLSSIATQMRKSFPSFGGVMMWDASQAYGGSLLNETFAATEMHLHS
jgi:chitinase